MSQRGVHILIRGKVQGVGFRFHTQATARKYDVSGWVKNMPDGSVEIEAYGKKENIERFIEWCKQGPSFARVQKLTVNDIPVKSEHSMFLIR